MTISFYDEVEMWPDIENYPIMDLQNNPNNLTIDIWYGTVEGLINNKDKTIERGRCKDSECTSIEALNKVNLTTWKGIQFKTPTIDSNYSFINLLKNSSRQLMECPSDLKQCGLLDTMNNKMCIDKDKECPINMIIMKNTSEPPTEYNYTFKNVSFDDGSYLFYTNEAIDQHIIGKFKISDKEVCIDPNEYNSDYKSYILDYYQYYGCKTSIENTVYNSHYKPINTMNKYDLYKSNKIIEGMSNLPNYHIEELKGTACM